MSISRRNFLTSAIDVGLTRMSPPSTAIPRHAPLTPEELKKRIRGPIMSIPTPFTADFAVDYEGVRNMVRLGQAHGIEIYELTAGNSQYHALRYEEVKELTRVLVEAVGGRGIVIAATGPWWTGQAVEYARFAESVGADAVQVMLPNGTTEGYVEHVCRIAASTRLGIVLQGKFTLPFLERLVQIPSVVSLKEDQEEKFYIDAQRKFGQRLVIFCGGQKWRFLVAHPYGSNAYFSTFSTFAPQITMRFWRAVQRNDMNTAYAIVNKYDLPFFDFSTSGPRSFPAYWRGVLEHFGVAKRYLRPPQDVCTEEDMGRITMFFDGLGLKSEARPSRLPARQTG